MDDVEHKIAQEYYAVPSSLLVAMSFRKHVPIQPYH